MNSAPNSADDFQLRDVNAAATAGIDGRQARYAEQGVSATDGRETGHADGGTPATHDHAIRPVDASTTAVDGFEAWQMQLHGHRVIYHMAGSGPAVVLIHGMLNSSRHWRSVALALADRYTVIAPDLIGHGDSATPRGDYSLGAHATSIRDLLAVLGFARATIVGHSLGGGVAMQFFYQFPQRTERLVLVSSGGLGREVSPLLRSATLPGAGALLSLAAHPRVLSALGLLGDRMHESGSRQSVYVQAIARALHPLEQPGARKAFLHTLRAVIDVHGQRVGAQDRLYLLAGMPTLIVWGERDNTIPLAHGRGAHRAAPGSRLVTLPRAAHFPHLEDPEGLAATLGEFLASTAPARIEDGDWGAIVSPRAPRSRREVVSAT